MRFLDLFSCAGAASVGYQRAGATYVEGWDRVPRSRYPFTFRLGDALDVLRDVSYLRKFDFIHASPPCQKKCTLTRGTNAHLADTYDDFYAETRALMEASGVPGVIENPSARPDVVLCGEMFGLGVIRHRNFERINWAGVKPTHKPHRGRVRGWRHGEWSDGPYIAAYGNGGGKGTVAEIQHAMGINWTDVREELTEAIPPAYTEWIGRQFLERAS